MKLILILYTVNVILGLVILMYFERSLKILKQDLLELLGYNEDGTYGNEYADGFADEGEKGEEIVEGPPLEAYSDLMGQDSETVLNYDERLAKLADEVTAGRSSINQVYDIDSDKYDEYRKLKAESEIEYAD